MISIRFFLVTQQSARDYLYTYLGQNFRKLFLDQSLCSTGFVVKVQEPFTLEGRLMENLVDWMRVTFYDVKL